MSKTFKTYVVKFTQLGGGPTFSAAVDAFSRDDAEGLFAGMRATHTVAADLAAAPEMLEALKDIAARCEREAAQFDPLSARALFASNIAAFARTQIENVEGRTP